MGHGRSVRCTADIHCVLRVLLFPFFQQSEDFLGVALGRDIGKDVEEGLVRADQKGCARNAPYFLPIHVLFLHHAKLIADFLV